MLDGKRLFFLVKTAELAQRAIGEPFFRQLGVSYGQYAVLSSISDAPDISAAELARALCMTAQSAGETVAALTGKGLISRTDSNAKPFRLSLTDEGSALITRAQPLLDALEHKLLAGLPSDRIDHAHKILAHLIERSRAELG
jgi:DNA-binding MarR family transcriptional regulator